MNLPLIFWLMIIILAALAILQAVYLVWLTFAPARNRFLPKPTIRRFKNPWKCFSIQRLFPPRSLHFTQHSARKNLFGNSCWVNLL